MPKVAICVLCGKEYIKNSASKICKDAHYRECEVCGKKFELTSKYLNRKCCSQSCANILGKRNREATSIARYGVANAGGAPESQAKIRKHSLEKYGVEHPFQAESVKEKIKSTLIDRYGVDNPQKSSIVQQKTANTCVERYGDTCVFGKNSTKRHEINKHNKEKYGVENLGGLPETIEKIHTTQINRYGSWFTQTNEYRQKSRETSLQKYGTEYPSQAEDVKEKTRLARKYSNHKYTTKFNRKFGDMLQNKYNIPIEYEYNIDGKFYDIHIVDTNIVIDINPTYTHSTMPHYRFDGIDRYYHKDRSDYARLHDFRCIQIWDWDDINSIVNLVYNEIYGKLVATTICDISMDDCHKYLSDIGCQFKLKSDDIICGSHDSNGVLVQVVIFRHNADNGFELVYHNTLMGHRVFGGIFNAVEYFINQHNPKYILYIHDISKLFPTELYTKLSFILRDLISPKLHLSKSNRSELVENILDEKYKIMINDRWLPIYDCGYKVWIWRR